jgi:uncharacterized protein (UPF0332 family)
MDPRLFLAHATRMLGEKRPEANRSAVSRAYYAVSNVIALFLTDMGLPLPRGAAGHGEAQHRLRNSKDAELEKVARQLNHLQGRRLHADYRLDCREIEEDETARVLVAQASSMIVVLDACRRDQERNERVRIAIEAYVSGSARNGP